jgi:hypothetical protein
MARPIKIAVTLAVTGFLALMLWQLDKNATAGVSREPGYAVTANPYLPIRSLGPVY